MSAEPLSGEPAAGAPPTDWAAVLGPLVKLDDSIKGDQEMSLLLNLLVQNKQEENTLKPADVELLAHTLLATNDQSLLQTFAKSHGMQLIENCISNTLEENRHDELMPLLKLLGWLPMTLNTLQETSISKMVNKMRKCGVKDVENISGVLVKAWKSLISSPEGVEARPMLNYPKDGLQAEPPASKRELPSTADTEAKRARSVKVSDSDGSNSLDAALSSAGRKVRQFHISRAPSPTYSLMIMLTS